MPHRQVFLDEGRDEGIDIATDLRFFGLKRGHHLVRDLIHRSRTVQKLPDDVGRGLQDGYLVLIGMACKYAVDASPPQHSRVAAYQPPTPLVVLQSRRCLGHGASVCRVLPVVRMATVRPWDSRGVWGTDFEVLMASTQCADVRR